MPLVAAIVVATVEAIAVAAAIGTAACARRWRGAGLVGPLPQLTVLVPAALGVLDVVTGKTLNVAPAASRAV